MSKIKFDDRLIPWPKFNEETVWARGFEESVIDCFLVLSTVGQVDAVYAVACMARDLIDTHEVTVADLLYDGKRFAPTSALRLWVGGRAPRRLPPCDNGFAVGGAVAKMMNEIQEHREEIHPLLVAVMFYVVCRATHEAPGEILERAKAVATRSGDTRMAAHRIFLLNTGQRK
jgi:hypothetical protein